MSTPLGGRCAALLPQKYHTRTTSAGCQANEERTSSLFPLRVFIPARNFNPGLVVLSRILIWTRSPNLQAGDRVSHRLKMVELRHFEGCCLLQLVYGSILPGLRMPKRTGRYISLLLSKAWIANDQELGGSLSLGKSSLTKHSCSPPADRKTENRGRI